MFIRYKHYPKKMKLIIDERETALYDKCCSIVQTEGHSTTVQIVKRVIPLGDILIHTDEDKEVCIIERKSLNDLLSSIKDGRYEEQSHRLSHATEIHAHNIIYIIEGMTSQLRSFLEKRIVYSAITSLNFFKGFSVYRTASLQETAEMIVWMADKIDRDCMKGKRPYYLRRPAATVINAGLEPVPENQVIESSQEPVIQNYCNVVKKVKKDNITPQNIGEIMLSQIPGISSVTAIAIMRNYSSFSQFLVEMEKNPDCLKDITYESNGKVRKINKSAAENISKFLINANTSPIQADV